LKRGSTNRSANRRKRNARPQLVTGAPVTRLMTRLTTSLNSAQRSHAPDDGIPQKSPSIRMKGGWHSRSAGTHMGSKVQGLRIATTSNPSTATRQIRLCSLSHDMFSFLRVSCHAHYLTLPWILRRRNPPNDLLQPRRDFHPGLSTHREPVFRQPFTFTDFRRAGKRHFLRITEKNRIYGY
jgi:hypothetical protein